MSRLTELTLSRHNLADSYKARKEHFELDRVETWTSSLASMRSGLKGRSRSSVTRCATTSAKVYTNAESLVSEGSICSLEEEEEDEDEECEYPSQDRNILGKRVRKMAEV